MIDSTIRNPIVFVCLLLSHFIFAQNEKSLSLNEFIRIASNDALDAYKAKRQYATGYWEYRAHKSRLLPKMNLELAPFTFNRSFTERYDPEKNIDLYRPIRSLNSFGQISVEQNVLFSGAKVYVHSTFNRISSFLDDQTIENFSTTPLRIGITQPIMAFNALRWEKKTAELALQKAKNDYILQQQKLNVKSVGLFFKWALAQTKLKLANENHRSAINLHEIGVKRFPLGTIEKEDLLNLELETFITSTALTQASQNFQEIVAELEVFLNISDIQDYQPTLPELLPNMMIDLDKAISLAHANNPDLIHEEMKRINAQRDLDQTIKKNRFDLTLNASFGLNQQAEEFSELYSHLLNQQYVSIVLNLPLLDWGERKGNIQTARMNKEIADIEIRQNIDYLKQTLTQLVNNFNLQAKIVADASKTKSISLESYEISETRFLSGEVDLLRLITSRKSWQNAAEQYLISLQNFWEYYYQLQQMTLFNFIDDRLIEVDYDELID
ncbi:MAG: TolC family protein [Flavobacteriaceae bacterium]|nr:TolC family protein [Flavobacteriaceae bacterium]MCY4266334.1 TolC family protein [Flavobacteriaceae bacterium]MCY4299298.1 TolC family protein [Flavobacteriaceae bacterium]